MRENLRLMKAKSDLENTEHRCAGGELNEWRCKSGLELSAMVEKPDQSPGPHCPRGEEIVGVRRRKSTPEESLGGLPTRSFRWAVTTISGWLSMPEYKLSFNSHHSPIIMGIPIPPILQVRKL